MKRFLHVLAVTWLCATQALGAVINVADHGAAVNDNKDDTAAIRAALSAAKPGDVVQFNAGTYNLGSTVDVAKAITLDGDRGKSWLYVNNNTFGFRVLHGVKPTFTDLAFDGSGITYDGQSGGRVDWVKFKNFQRGVNVGFGSGTALGNHNNGFDPQGWTVTNCTFEGNGGNDFGGWGIGFWRGNGVWITDNAFVNVGNGIKTNNGGATAHEIHVERNYMTGIRRMNAEMQGQVDGYTLIDNWVEKTRMSGNYNENINNLGWSVIYHGDETRNIQVKRNVLLEPGNKPDGTGVRIGFEVGNNAVVEDNYVVGVGTMAPIFMGDTSGPRSEAEIGHTYVRNNYLSDSKNGQGYGYGQYAKNAHFENNNNKVKLSAVMQERIAKGIKPGPGGGATTPPIPPTTNPVPSTFAIKGEVLPATAELLKEGGAVNVTLSNVPTGTVKVRIEPKATKAPETPEYMGPKTGPTMTMNVTSFPATIKGYHPAWEISLRAVAMDASAKTLATSAWLDLPRMPGSIPKDSELPWPPAVVPPTTQPTTPTVPELDYDITIPIRKGIMQQPTTRKAA